MMRLILSEFLFVHGQDHYRVRFENDDNDKPESLVVVEKNDSPFTTVANDGRERYRPCPTHCRSILASVLGTNPRSVQAARQRKASKPVLKLAEVDQ